MKHFLRILFLFFFLINLYGNGYSQCPTSNFDLSSSACLNENILVNNTSLDYSSHSWRFCDSDYLTPINAEELITLSNIAAPRDIVSTHIDNSIYSFIIGENNRLIRLFFVNGITNSPEITNFGNLDGAISIPKGIEYYEENGNHYLLITQQGGTLLLVSFGTDLNSTPTSNSVVGINSLNGTRGLKILKLYDGTILLYAIGVGSGNRQVGIINFGNSIENAPFYTEFSLPTASGLTSFSIIKECDNWFGFISSANNSKLFKLFFGEDPTTLVSSQELIGITTPYAVDLKSINNRYYALVSSEAGNLFRIDFGEDFTITGSEAFDDLGDLGILTSPVGLDIFSINNGFEGLTVGYTDKKLRHLVFSGVCPITTSGEQNDLNISFSAAGTYDLSLITVDDDGSVDRLSKSITITTDIAPPITFTSQNVCQSAPIQFTSESSSVGLTYAWAFGDTNTSTDPNPSHTYATAGEYEVTLEVQDGTCSNFVKQNIIIYDEPVPDFNIPGGNICTNQPYIFINSTPDNFDGLLSYEWQLDGLSIATTRDLDFEFTSGGTKELKLITTIPGCSVEVAKNILNIKEGTLPQFSFDDNCTGEIVQFTNNSVGTITNIAWDFGNGFTSSLENPALEFATDGTYNVSLTLTNSDGCVTSATTPITIHPLPTVSFSNELACENLGTQFTDLSSVTLDNLAAWEWQFDDGAPISNEQNPQYVFGTSGDFNVKLVTTTTFGCIDSVEQVVNVLQAPVADFSLDKFCIDVPIQFTDESTPVDGESITDWSWSLGGTFSSQQNPTLVLSNALDYNFSLTVKSQNLCTSTITKTTTIPPKPTVLFDIENDCANEIATFSDVTDITGDNILQRDWLLDNESFGNGITIDHQFSGANDYSVTLEIETENGCSYSSVQTITVNPVPVAAFSSSFSFGAPPFIVDFTNNSQEASTYNWTFEENTFSSDINPTHTFNDLGNFDVQLVAINDFNCRDSATQRIEVLIPQLDIQLLNFSIVPSAASDLLSITVKNNGTIRLDSMEVVINLGGKLDVLEVIKAVLNPEETITAQLSLQVNNRKLEYICASVSSFLANIEEDNKEDNNKCVTFNANQLIFTPPFPNPTKDRINLEIVSSLDTEMSVEIISSKGTQSATWKAPINEGSNKFSLDVSNLQSGLYFLKISIGEQLKTYRFVVKD